MWIQPQFSDLGCATVPFERSRNFQIHPHILFSDGPKAHMDSKPPLLRKGGLLTRHSTVPGQGLK